MDYLFNIYSRVSVWKYVHYINRINSIFSINKLQFYTIQAPKIQSGPTIFYGILCYLHVINWILHIF